MRSGSLELARSFMCQQSLCCVPTFTLHTPLTHKRRSFQLRLYSFKYYKRPFQSLHPHPPLCKQLRNIDSCALIAAHYLLLIHASATHQDWFFDTSTTAQSIRNPSFERIARSFFTWFPRCELTRSPLHQFCLGYAIRFHTTQRKQLVIPSFLIV